MTPADMCDGLRRNEEKSEQHLRCELRRRFWKFLFRSGESEAEDLLQELYLTVWKDVRANKVLHPERVFEYAWSCAANLVADYAKRKNRMAPQRREERMAIAA